MTERPDRIGPTPVTAAEFAALMARLGPYEARPAIAVAVSGGPDSLALALLASRWAADRGGTVHALTVDHRLRPESGEEAAQVGRMLKARDIPHTVLPWTDPRLTAGLQAAAREARYSLLRGWCAQAGVLHLLVAHHRDDQAETMLLRLAHGSAAFGLAGMAAITELPEARLLRPLLSVPPARLAATVAAAGLKPYRDPSNANPMFARARLRSSQAALAAEGLSVSRAARTSRSLGHARVALEIWLADTLASAVELHPAGFARLDLVRLASLPVEIAIRTLSAVLMAVGGGAVAPRRDAVERLLGRLLAGASAGTLAGCELRARPDRALLVYREAAAIEVSPVDPRPTLWDGRYTIRTIGGGEGLALRAVGLDGWRQMVAARPELRASTIPFGPRLTLPALWDGRGPLVVPHLGYRRDETTRPAAELMMVSFTPRWPLLGPGFMLA